MRLRLNLLAVMALLFALALPLSAQMDMPKPGPELQKLAYFAGNWKTEGDVKANPMGPGGKFSGVDHCEWMDGKFFLVTHSTYGGAMGNGTETSYMGYDTNEKAYTYDSFNSNGEADHAKGTIDGDTWNWTSEFKAGGQTMKGKFTVKVVSPTSYTMKYEMSTDGSTWNTIMEGKGTKQ